HMAVVLSHANTLRDCEVLHLEVESKLSPRNSTRKLYSTLRIGREALVRQWPMEPVSRWIGRLRALPAAVREQMMLTV
ncbi:hypothetical protein VC187_22170, partial [Xanthomonas campestris]|nr:hypothetical protein [Xanthomonas campestris]MEA9510417.1 hypothetical protein [Xanthomonas campestris]